MYRLRFKPETKTFEIHSSKFGAYSGPFIKICRRAIEMGVRKDDIECALDEMAKNDHTVAEFGIFGRFIFTKEK